MMRDSDTKSGDESVSSLRRHGWRFALGVLLIVGGYAAWPFIPAAFEADLQPAAKSVLTGLLGATPFLTKVMAVALMGRPAYELFKRNVWNFVRVRIARTG
ncbi:MAG: hypothetical protein MUO41_09890 [Methyloceanibacter sp.]|jgi:hypothetical protein|nr:hypothetical protein [Methyloceanibacter sp.]